MRTWKQRIGRAATDLLSLPPDALQDVSRVTILNGEEVVVERAASLLRVSESAVDIDLGEMTLALIGKDFVVTMVSQGEIHVHGVVEEMSYVRQRRQSR